MFRFSITTLFLAILLTLISGIMFDMSRPQMAQLRAPLYSEHDLLRSMWEDYKQEYLEADTYRTYDKSLNYITTSEGQSYTMLRAVWMDDKVTFDGAWQWTKDILKKDDRWTFAWRFGERADGSYGIQDSIGGNNSASDADTDIALALLLAHARWNEDQYLDEARAVIRSIWEHEVVLVNNQPYLLSNDLDKSLEKETAHINPSYMAPYAYRLFAHVDPDNNWMGLVDSTYTILNHTTSAPLDTGHGVLPPDWVNLDLATGVLSAPSDTSELTTKFGYEALRIPWRIALDYRWHEAEEADTYLKQLSFLSDTFEAEGSLRAEYLHDGTEAVSYPSLSLYGGSLPYFSLHHPDIANTIVRKKIEQLYNTGLNTWYEDPGYYSANWLWFGLAFHYNLLPNYTEDISYDQ